LPVAGGPFPTGLALGIIDSPWVSYFDLVVGFQFKVGQQPRRQIRNPACIVIAFRTGRSPQRERPSMYALSWYSAPTPHARYWQAFPTGDL
jgi:hypothetical protein